MLTVSKSPPFELITVSFLVLPPALLPILIFVPAYPLFKPVPLSLFIEPATLCAANKASYVAEIRAAFSLRTMYLQVLSVALLLHRVRAFVRLNDLHLVTNLKLPPFVELLIELHNWQLFENEIGCIVLILSLCFCVICN